MGSVGWWKPSLAVSRCQDTSGAAELGIKRQKRVELLSLIRCLLFFVAWAARWGQSWEWWRGLGVALLGLLLGQPVVALGLQHISGRLCAFYLTFMSFKSLVWGNLWARDARKAPS